MFTPITYFAPQGGGPFDPRLGGTLTVNHWYNFTDPSTMTLSGNEITDIYDQGSATSYDFTLVTTNKPIYNSNGYAEFAAGDSSNPNALYSTATAPLTLGNSVGSSGTNEVTVIGIWNYQTTTAPDLQRVFAVGGAQYYSLDFQILGGGQETPIGDLTINYLNGTPEAGRVYGSLFRTKAGWNGQAFGGLAQYGQYHLSATTLSWNGKYLTSSHSIDGSQFFSGLNNVDMGDKLSPYGAKIGARLDTNQNHFRGHLQHVIVYDGILTDANISDIYDSWFASDAPKTS
jgi:hypothetical protein